MSTDQLVLPGRVDISKREVQSIVSFDVASILRDRPEKFDLDQSGTHCYLIQVSLFPMPDQPYVHGPAEYCRSARGAPFCGCIHSAGAVPFLRTGVKQEPGLYDATNKRISEHSAFPGQAQ